MPPKASVVTPFFNTEAFLEECIRSVLGQSLEDFEYVLVDNRSTDGSLEIARKYAAADARVRVITNETFLPQVQNYNRALAAISAESGYCKIVQADDWIYRECLEQMVALADTDDSVGIVSSYRLDGRGVTCTGLPYSDRVIDGRALCRKQLLDGIFVFGSPTTLLYRASIVRARQPFFEEGRLHEDTEVCYKILKHWNFGFVHKILSFTRRDNDSIVSATRDFDPDLLDKLIIIQLFGAEFLRPDELASCWRRQETRYLRRLAEARILGRASEYWEYQRRGLATIGYELSASKLLPHTLPVLVDLVLNPKNTLSRVLKRKKLGSAT
jgi:glycosyltransferase involved in cell wall biosynthesis